MKRFLRDRPMVMTSGEGSLGHARRLWCMRRFVLPTLLSLIASGLAVAQTEPPARERGATTSQDEPDEVVVRGRRIGELRAEVEVARERVYELFNDLNSNDEFDVYCHKESRSGTNVPQVVCRAQFENRISAAAAKEYMSTLSWSCPGDFSGQECMFSDYSSAAISAAQGAEGEALSKRDQMKEEIVRLANQDERFAQAILDWYEANQQYEAARKRRNDD